jgi:hypothetical protein
MAKQAKVQEEVIPRVRDEDFVSVYTNAVGAMTSQVDLQLLFSHIQIGAGGKKMILDRALVSMSPAQAKALAIMLTENIKQWEATYGEINLSKVNISKL